MYAVFCTNGRNKASVCLQSMHGGVWYQFVTINLMALWFGKNTQSLHNGNTVGIQQLLLKRNCIYIYRHLVLRIYYNSIRGSFNRVTRFKRQGGQEAACIKMKLGDSFRINLIRLWSYLNPLLCPYYYIWLISGDAWKCQKTIQLRLCKTNFLNNYSVYNPKPQILGFYWKREKYLYLAMPRKYV